MYADTTEAATARLGWSMEKIWVKTLAKAWGKSLPRLLPQSCMHVRHGKACSILHLLCFTIYAVKYSQSWFLVFKLHNNSQGLSQLSGLMRQFVPSGPLKGGKQKKIRGQKVFL